MIDYPNDDITPTKMVSYIPPGTMVYFVRSDMEIEHTRIESVGIIDSAKHGHAIIRYFLETDDLWSNLEEESIYLKREDAEAARDNRVRAFAERKSE
jgi:hypothetical protein